jgi:hypothetical protein
VAEARGVDGAQLGDAEDNRRQGVADVGVGELRAQPLASRVDDRGVIERGRWQLVDGEPLGVTRQRGVQLGGDEREVRRGNRALARISIDIAARLELFEVGDIGEVDLRREVATERRAEAFGVTEWSTGERPGAFEGLASALPQQ